MERHFKGHRDAVTAVDFSPSMKQLGKYIQNSSLLNEALMLFHETMRRVTPVGFDPLTFLLQAHRSNHLPFWRKWRMLRAPGL